MLNSSKFSKGPYFSEEVNKIGEHRILKASKLKCQIVHDFGSENNESSPCGCIHHEMTPTMLLQARKMQESGWKPRWFAKDKATDTYRYLGGYWESREKGSWEGCPDIFGQVPNDLMITD
jgi:hypothetical protein